MYSVALAMIVRNESASLQRCLDSVRAVTDSLVVIDTGSSDDTVQIALAAGARVEHFTWIDDFAAARNFALATANANWNVILDADKWLRILWASCALKVSSKPMAKARAHRAG